jgi:hypothetical protein
MKKLIAKFLILMLCAMLGVGVFATDPTTVPPPDTSVAVTDSTNFDALLEGLTNSTFWTTTGTVLLSVIGMLAMFKKHFGNISTLISGKAETSEINKALKGATEEMSAEFCKKISELEAKLAEADNDEKKLMAMFTIFVSNANINPNAKAEIMKYLTGIKDISGKIVDVVETANKMIEDANAVEEKIPTPALNSIVTEDEDGDTESKMVLG